MATTLRVREAVPDDIPAIGRAGVYAFLDDPINVRLFGSPRDRSPDSPEMRERLAFRIARASLLMSKPGMLTTVAVDDALGGEVVGFAQWLRPVPPEAAGAEPQTEAEKEAAREAELSRFPPTMDREAYQEFHAMVDKEAKRIFGERGYKDLWYVAFLAVDPAHQRRGIGRLLLDWGLQRSAAEGRDVYLISTPAGKSLYLAAGFEDLGGFEFGGALQTSMVFRHRQAPSSS